MFKSQSLLHCISIVICSLAIFAVAHDFPRKRQWENPAPLVNFQVTEPVSAPNRSSNQYGCVHTQVLMRHAFANSYEKPFIGNYTPPPCSFNRVTMNLTVTVKGGQFDRLGIMYLGDTEVFRTSSAEPTYYGIVWTHMKEMEQYAALWNTRQKIIFDWPNVVNERYTGALFTTLTATFFTVPDPQPVADRIIPISAQRSSFNKGSAFMVPGQQASVISALPRNIERAVVSISANGQHDEEFWYHHVFDKDKNAFPNLKGHSPFREVQLLIDGQLAGVHWPFPVIFTGGIVPGLWRPVAGIDAFDLRQHEIDITPFIPLLCNGANHTFEIKVVGLADDGTLTQSIDGWWFVTGAIFLFLNKNNQLSRRLEVETFGLPPTISSPLPTIQMQSSTTTDSGGQVDTLIYNTTVHRKLTVTGGIQASSVEKYDYWSQDLFYSSYGYISDSGYTQHTNQSTQGIDLTHPSLGYNNTYSYPLELNSTIVIYGGNSFSIKADLKSGLKYFVKGPSVFPSGLRVFNITTPAAITQGGQENLDYNVLANDRLTADSASELSTLQTASGELFYSNGVASFSTGTMDQVFDFNASRASSQDTSMELYHRQVKAIDSSIVNDTEQLLGQTLLIPPQEGINLTQNPHLNTFVGDSAQALLGRGPGPPRRQLLGVDSAPRRQLLGVDLGQD